MKYQVYFFKEKLDERVFYSLNIKKSKLPNLTNWNNLIKKQKN